MPKTDIDVIREALKQMRLDADKATPGSWRASRKRSHDPHFGDIESTHLDADEKNLLAVVGLPLADAKHMAVWDPQFAQVVAGAMEDFLGMHWMMDGSRWSSEHRDQSHEVYGEVFVDCSEAKCIVEYSACNGCGTSTCKEIGYWLPIALAYLNGRPA